MTGAAFVAVGGRNIAERAYDFVSVHNFVVQPVPLARAGAAMALI
jgi:hypothetical protein